MYQNKDWLFQNLTIFFNKDQSKMMALTLKINNISIAKYTYSYF